VYTNSSPAGSTIVKIATDGTSSTFATGIYGVLWDGSGDLYTSGQNSITLTTPAGAVSTLVSSIARPFAVGLGTVGDLYVFNGAGTNELLSVSPGGDVTNIAYLPNALDLVVSAPEPSALVVVPLIALLTLRSRRRRDDTVKTKAAKNTFTTQRSGAEF
jgi:hypothetical protein